MKARTIITATLVVAVLAIPGFLIAQGALGGPGGHQGPGGHGMGMLQGLLHRVGDHIDLSDDQRAQIETIVSEQGPAIREIGRQMAEARQQFMHGSATGAYDAEAAQTFAETQAPLYVDMVVRTAKLRADVWAVLTPEQQQELEELRGLFGPRHRGRGPGSGRGPQGP